MTADLDNIFDTLEGRDKHECMVYLEENFNHLGSGCFGSVYKYGDMIIKVSQNDVGYRNYITCSKEHAQHNSMFPKIYKESQWKSYSDDIHLVASELLVVHSGNNYKYECKTCGGHLGVEGLVFLLKEQRHIKSKESFFMFLTQKYIGAEFDINMIYLIFDWFNRSTTIQNFFPDIHPANMGFRNNGELVVFDPVVGQI